MARQRKSCSSLREIVFDKKWLNSLKYYVRNRHTGLLEVKLFIQERCSLSQWFHHCVGISQFDAFICTKTDWLQT